MPLLPLTETSKCKEQIAAVLAEFPDLNWEVDSLTDNGVNLSATIGKGSIFAVTLSAEISDGDQLLRERANARFHKEAAPDPSRFYLYSEKYDSFFKDVQSYTANEARAAMLKYIEFLGTEKAAFAQQAIPRPL